MKTGNFADPQIETGFFFTTPDPKSMISGTDSRFFYISGTDSRKKKIKKYVVGVDFKCNEM